MHQKSRPLVRVYETLCAVQMVHYLLYCAQYTAYCCPRLIKGQLRCGCTMALCANDTAMLGLEPDTGGFPLWRCCSWSRSVLSTPAQIWIISVQITAERGQRVPHFLPNKAEQNGGSGVWSVTNAKMMWTLDALPQWCNPPIPACDLFFF